ncbi:MAG TPA: hypothetical protein ENK55_08860 [Actinobacteria bacterium]|nr:hypothetical protein [Actinomycetota bacterium]
MTAREMAELLDRCEATLREVEDALAEGDWERLDAIEVVLPTGVVPSPELHGRLVAVLERTIGLREVLDRRRRATAVDLEHAGLQRRAVRAYLGGGAPARFGSP